MANVSGFRRPSFLYLCLVLDRVRKIPSQTILIRYRSLPAGKAPVTLFANDGLLVMSCLLVTLLSCEPGLKWNVLVTPRGLTVGVYG